MGDLAFLRNRWAIAALGILCWAITTSSFAAYYYMNYVHVKGLYEKIWVTVDVYVDYGNGTAEHHSVTLANASAFNALLKTAEVAYETYPYGVYVTAINGVEVTSSSNATHTWGYGWLYFVNEVAPQVAADRYFLKTGDVVSWNYSYYSYEITW